MPQIRNRLFRKAAWLAAVTLPMLFLIGIFTQSQPVVNANIFYEGSPVVTRADVGQIILADCAKTTCVATKASDLAAQAEKVRQAGLANEVAQVVQAESYAQIPNASIRNTTAAAVQPVVVPKPEPRVVVSVVCNDGTIGKDGGWTVACEGHGGVRGLQ